MVVAGLDDDEVVGVDGVDDAVFLVDAAGPEAGQVAGEASGFAGANTRVASLEVDGHGENAGPEGVGQQRGPEPAGRLIRLLDPSPAPRSRWQAAG